MSETVTERGQFLLKRYTAATLADMLATAEFRCNLQADHIEALEQENAQLQRELAKRDQKIEDCRKYMRIKGV